MFPMTLTIHNPGQLNAIMALLTAVPQEPTTAELVQIAEARGAEIKKEAAAPKGKSAPSDKDPAPSSPTATAETAPDAQKQSTKQPEPQSSTAADATASSATEPVTYDQVAKAITEAAKADRDRVVKTLGMFNAKRGTELKPEQFADFLAALG